jgi:hypothetical protein
MVAPDVLKLASASTGVAGGSGGAATALRITKSVPMTDTWTAIITKRANRTRAFLVLLILKT